MINRNNIIELTNKLYRMTLFFPKKEPLRYKMREVADDILVDVTVFHSSGFDDFESVEKSKQYNFKNKLEILKSYFEIVKWQNWVSYFDVLGLQEEYDKIYPSKSFREKIELVKFQEKIEEKEEVVPLIALKEETLDEKIIPAIVEQDFSEENDYSLDQRKEKILDLLKKRGRLQVWQASEVLPEVSKRTLRRDFVQLLELGLIQRIGERNDTFYVIKNEQV